MKITKTDEDVLSNILLDSNITTDNLAKILNKSTRIVDRSIAKLKELGMIVRVGSRQSGHWKIIK